MRAKHLTLIALAAAAMAGAALAQPAPAPAPAVPSPPSPTDAREFNGGAEPGGHFNFGPYGGQALDPRPVYAVIAHHVVSGDIAPKSRLLTLTDERQPQFACKVFHRGPDVRLACSDGAQADLTLNSFGCGYSRGGEPASLCIGFRPKSAAKRLVAAPGETLRVEGGRLTLAPTAG
jgi:hypothetical protein